MELREKLRVEDWQGCGLRNPRASRELVLGKFRSSLQARVTVEENLPEGIRLLHQIHKTKWTPNSYMQQDQKRAPAKFLQWKILQTREHLLTFEE